ncbi:unnamed protein product, partial [Prorocentrum cordatum]
MHSTLKRRASAATLNAADNPAGVKTRRAGSEAYPDSAVQHFLRRALEQLTSDELLNLEAHVCGSKFASACSGAGTAELAHHALCAMIGSRSRCLFVCEIVPAKREHLIENVIAGIGCSECCVFEDVCDLRMPSAKCAARGNCFVQSPFMFLMGYYCKDLSKRKSQKLGRVLSEVKGISGSAVAGLLQFVSRHRPPVIIPECVGEMGKPEDQSTSVKYLHAVFRSLRYEIKNSLLWASDYGLPRRRQRAWTVAVNCLHFEWTPIEAIGALGRIFEVVFRLKVEQPPELEDSRPDPESQSHWFYLLPQREKECLAYAHAVRPDLNACGLSQQMSRLPINDKKHFIHALTPNAKTRIDCEVQNTRSCRLLTDMEALLLQGFPRIAYNREVSHPLKNDFAGNAFSSMCALALIIACYSKLPKFSGSQLEDASDNVSDIVVVAKSWELLKVSVHCTCTTLSNVSAQRIQAVVKMACSAFCLYGLGVACPRLSTSSRLLGLVRAPWFMIGLGPPLSGNADFASRVSAASIARRQGGGQILRMSAAYAALFGVPVSGRANGGGPELRAGFGPAAGRCREPHLHEPMRSAPRSSDPTVCISSIRAGRRRPGLAAQHLESLRLVREVSRGRLADDRAGSRSVTFFPGDLAPGDFVADPGTAGSITLMVQAALPLLLFAGGASTCALRGGTDVGFSPPLDYVQRVLRPTLGRMGAGFELECQGRGFFPKGGGSALLRVPGSPGALRPLDAADGGRPLRLDAVLRTTAPPGAAAAEEALAAVRQELAGLAPEVGVALALDAGPGRAALSWLDAVVETTTGSLFPAAPRRGLENGIGNETWQKHNNSEVRGDFSDPRWGPLAAPLARSARQGGGSSAGSRNPCRPASFDLHATGRCPSVRSVCVSCRLAGDPA